MSAASTPLLILSALIFAVGCFGLIARRSLVHILLGAELMLLAPIVLLVSFAVSGPGQRGGAGAALAIFAVVGAVSQLGVGMGLVLFKSRARESTVVDDVDVLGP
jgi:NADH-quinone oxidoreductase subunit K